MPRRKQPKTYDEALAEADALEARSAAAIEALQHESANLREAAEMRAKTALDLKATSDAQVKVASTVNLINRSMSGAFRALAALRARIASYKQETAQAADELLAEADEIESSLRANQEETFEAVTKVLGVALKEITGDPVPDEECPTEGERSAAREREEETYFRPPAHRDGAHGRAEDIDRRTPAFDDLDDLDGLAAPEAVPPRRLEEDHLDTLFAFMKESLEAIDGRMSEIERVISRPSESERAREADKDVREQVVADAEEATAGSNDGPHEQGREEDGGERGESQGEAADEAGPDLREDDPSPTAQDAAAEKPSHPGAESAAGRAANDAAALGREEGGRPEPTTPAAPTAVPSRLTRTSGFGHDAQTRPERVKEAYSSAQAIVAEREEGGPAPAGEPPVERQHGNTGNSLVEALKDRRGYL